MIFGLVLVTVGWWFLCAITGEDGFALGVISSLIVWLLGGGGYIVWQSL